MTKAVKLAIASLGMGGVAIGGGCAYTLSGGGSGEQDEDDVDLMGDHSAPDITDLPKATKSERKGTMNLVDTSNRTKSTINMGSTSYGDETIGKVYGRYLINTYDAVNKRNIEYIWDYSWRYFESERENAHTLFAKGDAEVAYAKSGDQKKGLNQLCASIYSKPVSEATFNGKDETDQEKLGHGILKFCSELQEYPTMITSGFENETIGKKYRGRLVRADIDDESMNKDFWKAQNAWFVSKTSEVEDDYFLEYLTKEKQGDETEFPLKEACHKAYQTKVGAQTSSKDRPLESSVIMYCTFGPEK